MKKLNPNHFCYTKWRSGSITDFGFPCREYNIIQNRSKIKQYAIGYCDSERTLCRQKLNHKATMYLFKNNLFWSHLTNKEFNLIGA